MVKEQQKPRALHAPRLNSVTRNGRLVLKCFGYVTGADTAGADLDRSHVAVSDCLDLLEVRVPYSTGFVVGMAYVVAEAGTFTADFTNSRHIIIPPLNSEKHFLSEQHPGCKGKLPDYL